MPQNKGEGTEQDEQAEEEVCDKGDHLSDLDEQTKCFLATFSTIRSKVNDVSRAESDLRKFELSIESERKRLQKNIDSAKLGLRNARVQMVVELTKVDGHGFTAVADIIKGGNSA